MLDTKTEREVILQALFHTLGNKAKAARTLKIDYKTMQSKVKKHGIGITKATLKKRPVIRTNRPQSREVASFVRRPT